MSVITAGITTNSALQNTGDTTGSLQLQSTTSGGTAITALTIDQNQNVGIGVTPSAWYNAGTPALQIGRAHV